MQREDANRLMWGGGGECPWVSRARAGVATCPDPTTARLCSPTSSTATSLPSSPPSSFSSSSPPSPSSPPPTSTWVLTASASAFPPSFPPQSPRHPQSTLQTGNTEDTHAPAQISVRRTALLCVVSLNFSRTLYRRSLGPDPDDGYYPGLVNISGTYCFMNATLQVNSATNCLQR